MRASFSESFWQNSSQDMASFKPEAKKTMTDKILKLIGVVAWAVAYIYIIRSGHSLQESLIFRSVLAYNLVWEAGKTFFWSSGDFSLALFIGTFWFCLDLEILRIFILYGDGTKDVSLARQHFEFVVWLVVFISLGYLATKLGDAVCRLWRHTSWIISILIQASILYHTHSSKPVFGNRTMAWSTMIGNICYLLSVRRQYSGWHMWYKYPVRCFMVAGCFIPAITFNFLYILQSHDILTII